MTTDAHDDRWHTDVNARITHPGLKHLVRQLGHHPKYSDEELLAGFVRVDEMLVELRAQQSSLGLRTLSAICFWGHAKFLDAYRMALQSALGDDSQLIQLRTIMISVYIAEQPKAALFIENFESFRSVVNAVETSPLNKHLHVIYSAGYRTCSEFIRDAQHTQTVHFNSCSMASHRQFKNWWFTPHDHSLSSFFWGDLDFEAMGIVKGLRRRFDNTRSWTSAYQSMLSKIDQGAGHAIAGTEKVNQRDPLNTGCDFADTIILPFIRSQNRFCDQEILTPAEVSECLKSLSL